MSGNRLEEAPCWVFGVLIVLEASLSNKCPDLTDSFPIFSAPSACQSGSGGTLSLAVEKSGQRTGGNCSASS